MFYGANVEALEQLAKTLFAEAERIDGIRALVTNQVHAAWWQGDDADRFRNDWDQQVMQLRRIVSDLEYNSDLVYQEAWNQSQISG